jgi:hypothetical protein
MNNNELALYNDFPNEVTWIIYIDIINTNDLIRLTIQSDSIEELEEKLKVFVLEAIEYSFEKAEFTEQEFDYVDWSYIAAIGWEDFK